MNLDNVTAEMRPRGDWEAADLGARMIRRDAAAIYRIWFAVTLPLVSLAMLLIAFGPYPALGALVYWWLEPIADGPILRVISRRLFGEEADVRGALRSTLHLARRNWIFLLSPYRFHFARSIAMPVTQLEGLSGPARRARAKVLNLKILNFGIGVTAAYQHLALALYIGVILVGFVFIPTAYQDTLGLSWMDRFWSDTGRESAALSLVVVYIAQSILEPWFVGAGFGLYINCRTQLEAWDIEVAFKRMVHRRTSQLAAAVVLAALVVAPVVLNGGARAEEPATQDTEQAELADPGFSGYWSDDEVRPAIDTVLASDALKTTREVSEWRAIDPVEPDPDSDLDFEAWWIESMQDLGRILSFIVEFSLWLGIAAGLCLLFATRKRWLPYLQPGAPGRRRISRVSLAGGDLSAADLPDDIPAEVLRLWRKGERRNALSLLYRGSVFAAVSEHGVRLPPSATEGACIQAVKQQTGQEQADYFARVVREWVRCAYAFDRPGDDTVLPLCEEWSRHYGNAT